MSSRHSLDEAASGFSTKTCLPASSAARPIGKCVDTGVARATASIVSSARTSSRFSYACHVREPTPDQLQAVGVGVADRDDLRAFELVEDSARGSGPSSRARRLLREPVSCGRVPLAEKRKWRAQEELEVQTDRPSTHVGDVHLERLAECRVRSSRHLPEAGEPLWHEEPVEVVGLEELGLVRNARAEGRRATSRRGSR